MSRLEISGIGIEYELLGKQSDPAVAITPGGRFSMESPGVRELGQALAAKGKRVLLWDRPNCGASDMCFEGDGESRLQARILTQLIRTLGLGPTALAGGSAGSRVSLLAAVEDPEVVSHLIQWWISGGLVSLMSRGPYCCEPAVAANMGGMEAVAALPAFAEQTKRNPRNRDIILSQVPAQFIATMERSGVGLHPIRNLSGARHDLRGFRAAQHAVLIFRGSPIDLYHPAHISEWVHELISALRTRRSAMARRCLRPSHNRCRVIGRRIFRRLATACAGNT